MSHHETFNLDHYRTFTRVKNVPPIAFSRLIDELYQYVFQTIQSSGPGTQVTPNLYRSDYILFSGFAENTQQTISDFIGLKIDTQTLLRLSIQTTHDGKEELKSLAKKYRVAWNDIDHTQDEKKRLKQKNFRIAVLRFPIAEAIPQLAVEKLVQCGLRHLPNIDMHVMDKPIKPDVEWFHRV